MKIQIEKLDRSEALTIVQAQKEFLNLIYVGPQTWNRFDRIYKIYSEGEFAGVCAVNVFGTYAKIGPFVLLPQMHGKGLGKALFHKIVEDFRDKYHLYIASSNPVVWHIAESHGFKEYSSLRQIPFSIWMIYQKMSLNVLLAGEFFQFLKELVRKSHAYKREEIRHYSLEVTRL